MATPQSPEGKPSWDKSPVVSLREVPNFGPVTLAEFESIGLLTLDQIDALGLEGTMRRWIQACPNRLNANAALGLVTALQGVVWTRATEAQRAAAHDLVNKLRLEMGLAVPGRRVARK